MAGSETNRFAEMETFVNVVECGGLSAAARLRRVTPSSVSKLLARLEARLGVRLLNRSTRQLQLTPEGRGFYENSVRLLADLREVEGEASSGREPIGRVRVNTSASFGLHVLAPLVAEFLQRYPAVSLDMVHSDALVDLLSEQTDVAIRTGPLLDSQLIARRLGETRGIIVGSPVYLAARGTPQTPDDLSRHTLLGFDYARALPGWRLGVDGQHTLVQPLGRVQASDGEALRHLALHGVGLAQLAAFTIVDDLAAGRLVPVLEAFNQSPVESFYALYVGQGGHVPSRVRVFIDFLVQRVRL
ncbi:LysR family transcriptional regulator [Pseudomonas sp. Fl5BN2]|uniref:LysR family transcriptional regulator n=1 Tax=unclassified Pseudomonas TaxID=196821 RepID=UPI001377FFC4|nr:MULTISPECIES: LysR family transcriptional regulator [unclassified Pseudomonas]NBF03630.1 LysR family transcriptional regulator [Pseudomonas sp. Fl5BN2]NBF12497.1 LysR family transcriptional regulator [Pseudomonas sp. Fl4BN1]